MGTSRANPEEFTSEFLKAREYLGGSKWLCDCECGNTTIVMTQDLTSGEVKSCGCYRHRFTHSNNGKTKVCSKCKKRKSLTQFNGNHSNCKECKAEVTEIRINKRLKQGLCVQCGEKAVPKQRKCKKHTKVDTKKSKMYQKTKRGKQKKKSLRKRNLTRYRAYYTDFAKRTRTIVLDAYGNKCAFCGEHRHEFLEIDHVNNDGRKDRLKGRKGTPMYRHIIKYNFPKRFQLLCCNCNIIKRALNPKSKRRLPRKPRSWTYRTCRFCGKRKDVAHMLCGVCQDCQMKLRKIGWVKLKLSVLNIYGRSCQCCGEKTFSALSIHHVNGGGGKHRKKINESIYTWILKQPNVVPGLTTLCMNCHSSISRYGYCPHTRESGYYVDVIEHEEAFLAA